MGLAQKRPEQAPSRIDVGEDPDHLLPSAKLFDEPFDRVGGPKSSAVLFGKGQYGSCFLQTLLKNLQGRVGLIPELFVGVDGLPLGSLYDPGLLSCQDLFKRLEGLRLAVGRPPAGCRP